MGIAASMGFVFAKATPPSTFTAHPGTQVSKWVPAKAYVRGEEVISPSNDVVAAKVAHTSSKAYSSDTLKWALLSTYSQRDPLVWNVLDYGMTARADVSSPLSSLITSVSAAGGGVVFIPAGTFYAADVPLAANVTLQMGPRAVLRLPNGSTADAILTIPTGANNITVTGGTLDGNRATYAGASGRGIHGYLTTAAGVTIRGVNFVNFSESGIYLATGISKVTVTECAFTSMGLHAVISYGGAEVEISRNRVDRTGDPIAANTTSIQFYVYAAATVTGPRIIGNHITGAEGTGAENALIGISWDVQPGGHCDGGVISGNKIRQGSMGISQAGVTNSSVVGNTIKAMDYAGIEVAGSKGVSVTGNVIDGKGLGCGIMVNPTGGCANLAIIGNSIANWGDNYQWGGIYVNEMTSGTIANNTLTGKYTKGESIYLMNVVDSTISGNVVRTTSANVAVHLIAGSVNCDGNVIIGNVIDVAGSAWSNGHILLQANTGLKISQTMILGNTITTSPEHGYGIALHGTDPASIVGTVVGKNRFRGFSDNLHETNATGTVNLSP
jgi:hypothetical protein